MYRKIIRAEPEKLYLKGVIQNLFANYPKGNNTKQLLFSEIYLPELLAVCNDNVDIIKTVEAAILDYSKKYGQPGDYAHSLAVIVDAANSDIELIKKNIETANKLIANFMGKSDFAGDLEEFVQSFLPDNMGLVNEDNRETVERLINLCLDKYEVNNIYQAFQLIDKTLPTLVDKIGNDKREWQALNKLLGFALKYKPDIDSLEKTFFPAILDKNSKICNLVSAWQKYSDQNKYAIAEEFLLIIQKPEMASEARETLVKYFGWSDEVNNWFHLGCTNFGTDIMFQYLGKANRHDALQVMGILPEFLEKMNIDKKQFAKNVLIQISASNAVDHEGNNAYLRFYSAVQNIPTGWIAVIESADIKDGNLLYEQFAGLKESLLKEDNRGNIAAYSSLKYFLKIPDLVKIAQSKELQEELDKFVKNYKGAKNNAKKIAAYITKLAFHPDVPLETARMLLNNPKEFFDLPDQIGTKLSKELHELKKPSNYFQYPFIDLTPEELRDALIDGTIDKLSPFKPHKVIIYEISRNENVLNQLMTDHKFWDFFYRDIYTEGLSAEENRKNVVPALNQRLTDPKFRQEFCQKLGRPNIGGQYIVEVIPRSDYRSAILGTDTKCCMSFGSGKNNIYLLNPNCGMFAVSYADQDGENQRIVMQSVLTMDKDIGQSVNDLYNQYEKAGTDLQSIDLAAILGSDFLQRISRLKLIAADNVEAHRGFLDKIGKSNFENMAKSLYQAFFSSYTGTFSAVDNSQMIIGYGNSDFKVAERDTPNTFLSLAPVAYSDNTGPQSGLLSLTREKQNIPEQFTGIVTLDTEHILEMSFLEDLAYVGKKFKSHLAGLETELIASKVNNLVKQREDISLAVYEDGIIKGFILAYITIDPKSHEKIIYVSDIAATPDSPGKGMPGLKLLNAFFNKVKDLRIPVIARARESTSFKLIKIFAKRYEYKLTVGEEESDDGENFYWVRLE